MPVYAPPLRDLKFLLHEVMKVDDLADVEGYEELTSDFTEAVFSEVGKLAVERLLPLNALGDAQGCKLTDQGVTTPKGFKEAFEELRLGGWLALECEPEFGGQGMPNIVNMAVGEMLSSANMSLMMYSGLTHGAYSALRAHGAQKQQSVYLSKLASCEWTGAMHLTEPHCGTDLGLIRTKAEPQEDGSYRLTGQKIFISAGDHDLAENVIHLVLAKIPGGPAGVKGISLFVVPKILVGENGALGARNAVACSKLEEKMGIHANATCVMDFDGATGWLVGEEHKGLRPMFTMMNEARLAVGMQGLSQASIAYQNAAHYAKERLQGRAIPEPAFPDAAADPIIVHPDVRRMLMDQRALVEGLRAFMLWGSALIDASHRHQDEAARKQSDQMIALLTPVLKAFMTDKGFDCAVTAQQVFGGHGYIEEWGMSQFVRDARIAMIYEGANGVQALDLVGRKLPQQGGAAMRAFFSEIIVFIKENARQEDLAEFFTPLKEASKQLEEALGFFIQSGAKNPADALGGSNDFLHMMGHCCLALMWARMAKSALAGLERAPEDAAFYTAKLTTARYYMRKLLPETAMRLARIKAGSSDMMALPAEAF